MAMQVRVITKQQNKATIPSTCRQCPDRAEIVVEVESEDRDDRPIWIAEYLCRSCALNLARIVNTANRVSVDTL